MSTTRITWQDLQEMPDDRRRREAVGGELYVSAAPSSRHQEISVALAAALHDLLVEPGHGRVFHAPGVEFPASGEGVQPDLVFVSGDRPGIVGEDWIRGAPDLVVEILSPSTEGRDRGVKRKLYRRQGVREYWIVDPATDAVEVWRFGAAASIRGDPEVTRAGDRPSGGAADGEAAREPGYDRFTDRLPVRHGGEIVGEIDLPRVLSDS